MGEVKPGAIIIEGHIQGLSNTRSLGEAGIPVYVVDKTNCIARYSKYCKKFFKCPDFAKNDFIEFLLSLTEKEKVTGWLLIPSNDHAVINISKNRDRLEDHFKVITPGLEIIRNIYDKSRLIELAKKCKVPVPATFYPDSPKPENFGLKFPLLIKGRHGLDFYKGTGKKVFLVHTLAELHKQLHHISLVISLEKIFVQELIPSYGLAKTVSFTAFCINGEIKTYWMGVKLREHPVRFGTATFAESIYVEECLNQSVPLLKALNYTGVCEVEYLQHPHDGEYKLIEINARTWLWVELAKKCGINFALIVYNYVNNINQSFNANYITELKWRNPFTDFIFTTIALIGGYISIKTIFKQNKGIIINTLSCKGDNKPILAYFYLIILFLFRR